MKKLFYLLALLLLPMVASADVVKIDGINYNLDTSEETAQVTRLATDYSGEIKIPESVSYQNVTYKVTSIGWQAFGWSSDLISVTVPNSVTTISEAAFFSCEKLTSVSLGNGLTFIGSSAFGGCVSLTSIVIPNSVTTIEMSAFSECTNLKTVKLPEGLKSVGHYMFSGCSSLTSIDIPNSVTSIGYASFAECSSLATLTLGSGLTSIDSEAFQKCESLTSVIIPDGCSSIGSQAFRDCKSLENIDIPKSVTSIGTFAFDGTSWIKKQPQGIIYINNLLYTYNGSLAANSHIDIEEGTIGICGQAFAGCWGLTSISIPNSVKDLGGYTFYRCSNLTTVNIPQDIENIPSGVFYGCSQLSTIDIPNSVKSIGSNAFDGTKWYNSQPDGMVYAGKVAYKYKGEMADNTKIVIDDGTLGIADYAFSNCTKLSSVTIPNSVTNIGMMAFSGCKGLTEVRSLIEEPFVFNSGNQGAFSNYDITLYVPKGTKARYEATEGWNKFTNIVEMGDVPPTKEPYAVLSEDNTVLTFYYDDNKVSRGGMSVGPFDYSNYENRGWQQYRGSITTVVFDSSFADYTELESTAYWFHQCTKLATFENMENLKTDNVTNMEQMFFSCDALVSVDLSSFNTSNVVNMSSMFGASMGLTSLDLSKFDTKNVTNMHGMFDSCYELSSLNLSGFNTANVTAMDFMFYDCKSLTSLDLSSFNTAKVSDMTKMFYKCNNLKTIYADGTKWSTEAVTRASSMFKDCSALVGGNGTVFDENHTDAEYARIDKNGQPGYFTSKGTNPEPSDIAIDATNFPDEIFRQFVLNNCDTDSNTYLSEDEISAVLEMHVNGMEITDLKGVEYFTALTKLYCQQNLLTGIDVSKNTALNMLCLSTNQLTELNVSNNTNLTTLWCEGNMLTVLDVSDNTNLVQLNCEWNQLTSLNVPKNSALSFLDCSMNSIKGEAMDALIENLPDTGGRLYVINSNFDEHNVITKAQVASAKEKGWISYISNNGEEYEGSDPGVLQDGDTFTALTVEGVEVTYKVLSAADKTCQLGGGDIDVRACDVNTTGTVTVPEVVKGFQVTTVGGYAFYGCSELTQITLPETIKTIWWCAFENCSGLTSFTIPSSVTRFYGNHQWNGCKGLTSIHIPANVTSMGNHTFANCPNILEVTVDENNPVFESPAGSHAIINKYNKSIVQGFKNTVIPEGITYIESAAFVGNEYNDIVLPKSFEGFYWDAFEYNAVRSITVAEGNTLFDSRNNCNALMETATDKLVKGCANTVIPSETKVIGEFAFAYAYGSNDYPSLKTVVLPEGLTKIEKMAFGYCNDLEEVTIPSTVTEIMSNAFIGSDNMTKLVSYIQEPFALGEYAFDSRQNENITLYVPVGTKALYEATEGWKEFPNIVEMGAEHNLCPDDHHPHMIDLGLPSGTKWACCNVDADKPEAYGGYYAWGEVNEWGEKTGNKDDYNWSSYAYCDGTAEGCYYLGPDISGTNWDVAHVKWGGPWVMPSYEQCMELKANCPSVITTYNGVKGRLFTGTNGASLFIPAAGTRWYNSTYYLDVDAFCWSSTQSDNDIYTAHELCLYTGGDITTHVFSRYAGQSVRPVIAASSPTGNIDFADAEVKRICVENWDSNGDGELSYDEAAAVTDLGQVFFSNRDITVFKELQYFTGLTSIAENAFGNCSNLTEVIMPQTITCILPNAFIECNKLVSADIPSSVTEIGYQAFHDCHSLASITIPNGITQIDYNTFTGTGISSITIPESVETLIGSAFACTQLTSVSIPASVKNINGNPFVGCNLLETMLVEEGNPRYHSDGNCIIETATNRLVSGCKASIIPSYITTLGETSLGNLDFTEFEVPEGITTLENSVFNNNIYLERVSLPSTLTSLDEYAIYWCNALRSINVKMKNPFPIANITQHNQALETLYVPAGTKALYEATEGWKEFPNIVEMDLQDGDTFTALTVEGVEVTYKVLSAADKTCQVGVWSQTHYGVPVEMAISTATTGTVTIPEEVNGFRVTEVGACSFQSSGITTVNLPESIVKIREDAFNGCYGLNNFVMPSHVEEIAGGAFCWCTSLESITLPESLTSIGGAAFQSCKNLRNIYSEISEPFGISEYEFKCYDEATNDFLYSPIYTDAILHVPAGCKAKYESTPSWNLFAHIVEPEPEVVAGDITGTGVVEDEDVDAFIELYLDDEIPEEGDADFSRFDANGDGIISLADAVAIFYLSNGLNFDGTDPNAARASEPMDIDNYYEVTVEATELGNGIVRYTLTSDFEYAGFAIDVKGAQVVGESAEGMTLRSADPKGKHRIVAYNFGQAADAGTVLTLDVLGEAQFSNINFSDANARNIRFRLGETTGIGAKLMDNGQLIIDHYYDLQGRASKSMKKGVNILRNANGKAMKVSVK